MQKPTAHEIAWLIEDEVQGPSLSKPTTYGDITELNTKRTIMDTVGQETLKMLAEDIMALLDTSVAVYEKNGDYAFGCFVSEWCSFMDNASRKLCNTSDNRKALDCGRWLCHENCWNDSAKAAIKSGTTIDIACVGGIRLYAVPIFANEDIIGAINMGYGNPPTNNETLENLSRTFGCDIDPMRKAAEAFKSRPSFIFEIAKKRLRSIAVQIGKTIEATHNEEKLKELALFPEQNQNPVLRIDKNMKLLYANPAAKALILDLGNVGDQIPLRYHKVINSIWNDSKKNVEVKLGDRWFLFIGAPIRERGYMNIYGTDISERIAMERKQHLLAGMLDSSPIAVIASDEQANIIYINKATEELFGYNEAELLGQNAQIFNACEDPDAIQKNVMSTINSGAIWQGEILNRKKNGELFPLYATVFRMLDSEGKFLANVGFQENISKRKKQEEINRNAQRLESLGVLAGGIAHDFNNLLGGIFGNIDLALASLGDSDQIKCYLETCIGALGRAKDLTLQLLTFSKGGTPHKISVDIARILKQSQQLSLSGSNIDCSINIAPNVSTIKADENQLCQVFNNIMINARQAMPSGGKLLITLENCTVRVGDIHGLASGEFVKIAFTDNGVGIPNTLLNKVFDPFFTTKDTGSGLGMATSFSIIHKHNGTILIDSELGKGTTVTINLPAGCDALPEKQIEEVRTMKIGGRVLVMDDEELMRNLAKGMLELLGFHVVCTSDGREAVKVFTKHMKSGNPFDIVLLDLTIPGGMGGEETMREIRKLDKSVLGIVASGYADSPVLSNPVHYGFSGMIGKPYQRATLAKVIEDLL